MNKVDLATFGAGCFWGVEEAFRVLPGVIETTVGYAGGDVENPGYEQVCGGKTGHAEVVQVKYDPETISFEKLLSVFWDCHNPTTLNRQGPDIGHQYRSVIFYHNDEQKNLAKKIKDKLEKAEKFNDPIVTAIEPFKNFYPAEEYHQKYFMKNGGAACHI